MERLMRASNALLSARRGPYPSFLSLLSTSILYNCFLSHSLSYSHRTLTPLAATNTSEARRTDEESITQFPERETHPLTIIYLFEALYRFIHIDLHGISFPILSQPFIR